MKQITQVSKENLNSVVEVIRNVTPCGFDTETTGASFCDLPFLLTVASTCGEGFYFDLAELPKFTLWCDRWYSHNAKFDLQMLRKVGVEIVGDVRCTMVAERLLKNDRLPQDYSLEATAKRYGMEKDRRVDEYIKAHGLYEKRHGVRHPRFDLVPRDLMLDYATKDAWLHLQIGMKQDGRFKKAI